MYRLLDVFCGPGGMSRGYANAGFKVTGVDQDEQPSYPYTFRRADALEYIGARLRRHLIDKKREPVMPL